MKHGKLVDGRLVIQEGGAEWHGAWYATPAPWQLEELGWKPVRDCAEAMPPDGKRWGEVTGYEEDGARILAVRELVDAPKIGRRWTPLTIMRAAKAAGLWTAIEARLEETGILDEFMACQVVSEDDRGFARMRAGMVEDYGEDAVGAFFDTLEEE